MSSRPSTVWGTASASAEGAPRPLPRLWMLFAAVGLLGLISTLTGLILVRVYDAQLTRQTEAELWAQAAAVAEVYRGAVLAQAPEGFGLTRQVPWPLPSGSGGGLEPLLPQLGPSSPVRPAVVQAPLSGVPDPVAAAAGAQVGELLRRMRQHTLAGIRVVDPSGVVVATSNAGLHENLRHLEEVQEALRGQPLSLLRARAREVGDRPLESLSRDTGLRVHVALPVLEGDRVLGAVVLSRTPMTLAKAAWADRWNLGSTLLVLIGAVGLVSLVASAFIVRPVRQLVRQTRAIARGEPEGFEPITRPVVQELAELSVALAGTARALRDRNAYISSFAAHVSHEFKTPLSAIQGAVELLRDGLDRMPPEQRARFLENIDRDAKRLTRLVHRLLELARAEAEVETAFPGGAGCDAAELLRGLTARASATGMEVSSTGLPERWPVPLPSEVVESVVWQLVTNAHQHGGPGVRIRLQADPADPGRLRVGDDGAGIASGDRARIFEPFFSTARDRGGTGMGLPIARALLRRYGASLELLPDSPGARGTAFELRWTAVTGSSSGRDRPST